MLIPRRTLPPVDPHQRMPFNPVFERDLSSAANPGPVNGLNPQIPADMPAAPSLRHGISPHKIFRQPVCTERSAGRVPARTG